MQRTYAQPAPAAALAHGHPIRRSLVAPRSAPKQARRHEEDNDLKLFALSFTAFFICIYTLIF